MPNTSLQTMALPSWILLNVNQGFRRVETPGVYNHRQKGNVESRWGALFYPTGDPYVQLLIYTKLLTVTRRVSPEII